MNADERARAIMAMVTAWLQDDSQTVADDPCAAIAQALTEARTEAHSKGRAQGLREAAEVAEEWEQNELDNLNTHGANTAACIATAIQALIDNPHSE